MRLPAPGIARLGLLLAVAAATMLVPAIAHAADRDTADFINYLYDYGCIFCDFSGRFIQITDRYSKDVYMLLAQPTYDILKYLFAIWLIIQSVQLSLGMGAGKDAGSVFWGIVKKTGMFLVVTFALYSGEKQFYWDVFYEFPLSTAMEISEEIMGMTSVGVSSRSCTGSGGIFEPLPISAPTGGIASIGTDENGVLCSVMKQLDMVEAVDKTGIMTGVFLIWNSANQVSISNLSAVGTMFEMILGGLVLVILFAFAMLYFAFFVMDILFRITFISAFGPFLLGAAMFGPTRQFAVRAIGGIVQSAFTLMGVAVIYGTVLTLMNYVPVVFSKSKSAIDAGVATLQPGQFTEMLSMFSNNVPFTLLDPYFWYMMIAGIMAIAMAKKVAGIMQGIFSFNDGSFGMADTAVGVASNVTKMAMGGAAMIGGAALYSGGKVALGGAKDLAGGTLSLGARTAGFVGAAGWTAATQPRVAAQWAADRVRRANPFGWF